MADGWPSSPAIRYTPVLSVFLVILFLLCHCHQFSYHVDYSQKVVGNGVQWLNTATPPTSQCHDGIVQNGLRGCCARHYEGDSVVCVCNSTYCDDLPAASAKDTPVGTYVSFRSSKSGFRFQEIRGTFDGNKIAKFRKNADATIAIGRSAARQTVIGFGGAFTDSAALNILSLSENTQNNFLRSYFSQSGSEYSMARIPMAGSDFSTDIYSYDDFDGDFDLAKFALTKEDLDMKIPLIKRAESFAGRPLDILASPWSAPAWMKTNGLAYGRGTLKGVAGDAYHQTWANYFVKFIQRYEANNVTIWGITTQNEPVDGYIPSFPFNAMGFTPSSQRDFIAQDLGPALEKAGLRRVKVIILDDQRILLPYWADTVLAADTPAATYVDGVGVHWYFNSLASASRLTETHQRHPEKFLLSTEACEGSIPWVQTHVILGDWGRAESYAHDVIENLSNWVSGWIDWNLALNEQGGPNWVNNFVDSPVIVNASNDEFYKQPMYYALAHFSKFIPPQSSIVEGNLSLTRTWWSQLMDRLTFQSVTPLEFIVAQRHDGALAVVVMNKGQRDINLRIVDDRLGRGSFQVWMMARSIQTFVWW